MYVKVFKVDPIKYDVDYLYGAHGTYEVAIKFYFKIECLWCLDYVEFAIVRDIHFCHWCNSDERKRMEDKALQRQKELIDIQIELLEGSCGNVCNRFYSRVVFSNHTKDCLFSHENARS